MKTDMGPSEDGNLRMQKGSRPSRVLPLERREPYPFKAPAVPLSLLCDSRSVRSVNLRTACRITVGFRSGLLLLPLLKRAGSGSAECSGASIHIRHLCLAPPGSSLYTYWIGFFPVIAYNQFSKILTHIVHFVKLFFLPALLRL